MVRHPTRIDHRERIHFVFDTTFELRERYRQLIPGGRSNKLMNEVLAGIVELATTPAGQHILLAVELGMLSVADALQTAARTKGVVNMKYIRMTEVGGTIIEEYEYQGRLVCFVDGKQVLDTSFDELVQAEQQKGKEKADAGNP